LKNAEEKVEMAPTADKDNVARVLSCATAVEHPDAPTSATGATSGTTQHDYDVYLLSVLASSGITRSDEVAWEGLQIDHAQKRWQVLVQEIQSEGSGNDLVGLSLSGVAQVILDRKTSAKMAAETVEAVNLPTPETLNSREI
jgi:hypothetical protein